MASTQYCDAGLSLVDYCRFSEHPGQSAAKVGVGARPIDCYHGRHDGGAAGPLCDMDIADAGHAKWPIW